MIVAETETGSQAEEGENYFISMTDMMVGVLFIFIIMLMVFALEFRTTTDINEDALKKAEEAAKTAQETAHDLERFRKDVGDENVHRVRSLLDEVFGEANCISEIVVDKTSAQTTDYLSSTCDFILFYAKNVSTVKYREVLRGKGTDETIQREYRRYRDGRLCPRIVESGDLSNWEELNRKFKLYRQDNIVSQRPPGDFPVPFEGREFRPITGYWKTGQEGMARLIKANRIELRGKMLSYVRYFEDYPVARRSNYWGDAKFSSRSEEKTYVVQTSERVIERCILMSTDPGDLVLDPTCGSGTTATVAEQWGRRWITIDTSRVALALARARVMGARYPFYLLADSREGQIKEGEITGTTPSSKPVHDNAGEARALT